MFVLIVLLLSTLGFVKAQDATTNDCARSKDFARYLFYTKQYDLARHELERVGHFCGFDSTSQLMLLQTLRKGKLFTEANQRFAMLGSPVEGLNTELRSEYIRLLMVQGRYDEVLHQVKAGMVFDQKPEHHIGALLLKQGWSEANAMLLQYEQIESMKMNVLKGIAMQGITSSRKNPWLAAVMSVILPGSGKMYSGFWGDGAIALTFCASSAFFTYRAFNKYGNKSVYPWIVGGIATSYYLGNVYGGYQAANRYNNNLNHRLVHETERALFSDY
jgi:TM2 domain-containing membrane protein YozV